MVNDPLAPPPPGVSVTALGDIASLPCPPPAEADDEDGAGEVAGAEDETGGAVVVPGVTVTFGVTVGPPPGVPEATGVASGLRPVATPDAEGASPFPPPGR